MLEILHLLYHLLKIPPLVGLRSGPSAAPTQVQAAIDLAADILGCTPRVSLAMGLARVVRALTDAEPIGGRALAGAR